MQLEESFTLRGYMISMVRSRCNKGTADVLIDQGTLPNGHAGHTVAKARRRDVLLGRRCDASYKWRDRQERVELFLMTLAVMVFARDEKKGLAARRCEQVRKQVKF